MPSANRGRHPPFACRDAQGKPRGTLCRDAFLRLPKPPGNAKTRKTNHAKPTCRDAFLRLPKPPGNAKTQKTNTQKPCRDAFLRLPKPPGNAETQKTNTQKPCRDAFLRLSQPPSLRGRRFYSAISRAETRERVSTTFRRTHEYTPRNPDDGRRGHNISASAAL